MTVAVAPSEPLALPGRRPVARALSVAVLVAVAVAAAMRAADIQVVEAAVARPVLAVLLGQAEHLPGSDKVFYPNYTGVGWRSLQITPLCSATPLVLPILALGVLAVLQRRFSPLRAGLVTLGLVVALFAINVGRIVMICFATRHWGPGGFELTHRVVGSVLIMAALAGSLVVGARLLSSSSASHGPRSPRVPS